MYAYVCGSSGNISSGHQDGALSAPKQARTDAGYIPCAAGDDRPKPSYPARVLIAMRTGGLV